MSTDGITKERREVTFYCEQFKSLDVYENILERLVPIDINDWFYHVSFEEFVRVLLENE